MNRSRLYHPNQEKWNVLTHAIAFVLSGIGFYLLFEKFFDQNFIPFALYGFGLMFMFLCSTMVHYSKNKKIRLVLNLLDHIAIDLLIASTYTPIAYLQFGDTVRNIVLSMVWLVAIMSIIMKLFWIKKSQITSFIAYFIFAFIWLLGISFLSNSDIWLLVSGNVCFAIGIVFYLLNKIPFNHVVFHVLVIIGCLFHFWEIYFYPYEFFN